MYCKDIGVFVTKAVILKVKAINKALNGHEIEALHV